MPLNDRYSPEEAEVLEALGRYVRPGWETKKRLHFANLGQAVGTNFTTDRFPRIPRRVIDRVIARALPTGEPWPLLCSKSSKVLFKPALLRSLGVLKDF
jgi:hypothetical protein